MKLQRVHKADEGISQAALYRTICAGCRASIPYWCAYADMEGRPFEAFYCEFCAQAAGQHDGVVRTIRF
jgi:hypothetical protein